MLWANRTSFVKSSKHFFLHFDCLVKTLLIFNKYRNGVTEIKKYFVIRSIRWCKNKNKTWATHILKSKFKPKEKRVLEKKE